jgi:uncharacterized protein (DUF2336 family)
MTTVNIPNALNKIVVEIENENYKATLPVFRDVFTNATEVHSVEHQAEITAILLYVFKKISLLDRVMFLKSIANSKHLPQDLCIALLKEAPMVSSVLLEHAQIPDNVLLGIIEEGDASRLSSIAKREKINASVSDGLTRHGNLDVLLTLASNPKARLSPEAFDVLASVAMNDPKMDKALSGRSDLPVEIARKLHRALTERNKERMSKLIATDLSRSGRRPLNLS